MIPRPAQYVLRFDDLSPALKRSRWERFATLIKEFGVRPILAIIPENRNDEWDSSSEDPEFWAEMREMQASGAAIAIHGYQHRCENRGKTLLGLHRRTEFGGVDLDTQREWIRAGIDALKGRGLNPRLFVAPRHGFDRNTLRALREQGVGYLSDGFARVPFVRGGVTWIPQQLWSPVFKSKGLWTICIHPETARSSEVNELRQFLESYAGQFTTFDRVVKEFKGERLGLTERVYSTIALWRVQRRHARARRKARRG